MKKHTHEYFMQMAMKLAVKAKGRTSPNPLVGALVVKNGRVISGGYHQKAGQPHAEIMALDKAGLAAQAATLYVTLEPCAHFGRTPPCVNRIIKSGVKEVIVGMIDPNPLTNGKGIAVLRAQGIKVKVGVLEPQLRRMNEAFIKYITTRLPFVTVKVGQSLDGRIATSTGDSKWITSDKSRAYAHRLRQQHDAVMVGINTVLRDNPKLDTWFGRRNPVKVVVDSRLSTPVSAQIFARGRPVIILTLPIASGQETPNRKMLAEKARIVEVKEKAGQINLKDALKKLAQLEITTVLVEGGGTLVGGLFDDGLVDKVLFFVSPKIIGGKEAIGSVMGKGVARVERAHKLKDVRLRRMGEDFLVEGYV